MSQGRKRLLTFRGVDAAAVLFGLGKYPKALSCVNRVLERNPGNVQALLLRAKLLSHLGHSGSALKAISDLLCRQPGHYEALLTKAGALVVAGQYEEALRIFPFLARRRRLPAEERRYLYAEWLNALIGAKRRRAAKRVLAEALCRFPHDDLLQHYAAELYGAGGAPRGRMAKGD